MRCLITFGFVFLSGLPLFGQDLGQLNQRATRLWELRRQMNRVDALQLIEPETRQIYFQQNEQPITSFKISGLEFTGNPNRVDLLVTVRSIQPAVGAETDRVVREAWVWKNGQWLMHATPTPTMFDSDVDKRAPAAVIPEFQITNTLIDAGRHAQGALVEGKIAFRAVRQEIVTIRPLQTVPGLVIGAPVWGGSSSEGYIPYQWDTALLDRNIDQKLSLQATATSDGRKSIDLQFRIRVDAKIGFRQIPEIVDPAKPGQFELEIRNLTGKPLKILGANSTNSAYVLDEDIPELIDPGKSDRLLVLYNGQINPTGASLRLTLSESLTPSGIVTVPINVKMPEMKTVTTLVDPATLAPPKLPSAPNLPSRK
jgi:hypothetical protein